jgi:cholesterol oxidase
MLKQAYDVVIIGSGFGGSVLACRLAQAQRAAINSGRRKAVSICVLERGKRYHRGEFPRDLARSKDWFWRNEGKDGWNGLLDFRSFDGIDVVCGSGVGGTSLVYLDVQLEAFPTTLRSPRWPKSVDWVREMPAYYQKIFDMLHPTPIPEPPLKAIALKAGADGIGAGDRFRLLPLAIYWGRQGSQKGVLDDDPYGRGGPPQMACQNCGECFIGCNTHSKNTMDLTYLWEAERAGAEVYSQHRVSRVEPNPTGHPICPIGYTVHYEDLRWNSPGILCAKKVIVAAGTVGSTELLLHCKHGWLDKGKKVPATLPDLSPMLGKYFSGNGDFGALTFKSDRLTEPMEGPTITATIDFSDKFDGRGFIVEDGGVPDFLRANLRLTPGGLASGRRLWRFVRDLFRGVGGRQLAEGIFNQLDYDNVRDVLPYLVMGADAANGEMSLDEQGNLQIHWPYEDSLPFFREIEKTLKEISESPGLNGNLFLNPTWSTDKQLITVHPLGGCPIGDDVTQGVVDPQGAVFNYPNLYVVDGSIVPSAIGPNPSKTIGALAERVAVHMIQSSQDDS